MKWNGSSLKKGLSLALLAVPIAPLVAMAGQTAPATPKPVDFVKELMPIVEKRCVSCHGARSASAGLDLRTVKGWQQGGRSGALLVAGDSKKSLLIQRLTTTDARRRMPARSEALPKEVVDKFAAWVDQGAVFTLRTFEKDVQPLFSAKCGSCHTGDRPKGRLLVQDYDSLLRTVTAKDPAGSNLVRRLKGLDNKRQMPAGMAPLSEAEIAVVEDWIRLGMPK